MNCTHFLNLHDVEFGPSLVECPFDFLFDAKLLGAKAKRCTSWLPLCKIQDVDEFFIFKTNLLEKELDQFGHFEKDL
jgi:hypothetical protein